MFDTAKKIIEKTRSADRSEFDSDENLRLALTHLLQIIGEAASRVSREYREEHAEIAWKAIIGMRQKVVHDYLNVDEDVVWDTAKNEVPALLAQLQQLVDD